MLYTLSSAAKQDLTEIGDWIALDNPYRAIKIVQELRAEFRKIAESPLHYQLRPDIGEDARLAVVGHHVILFWIDEDIVRFERVVYAARDLPFLYQ